MFFGFLLKSKLFLDELMKPKFYKKCQSAVSVMKIRLQIMRRKKNAMVKFLKMDIVDLLNIGRDYNAYIRAEGLLQEKRRLSCYDLIEQFCDRVFANLSLMLKQKEFPEECREAVSSLIYAAARVAEVPELKHLRALFIEKYGNFAESFVNQELIEKLEHWKPSREEKIQTMRDIAQEFKIRWDSKALQQILLRQSSVLQIEQKDQSSSQITNDQYTETKTRKNASEVTEGKRYSGHRKATIKGDSSSDDESVLSPSSRRDSLLGSSSSSSSEGSLSEDETDINNKTLPYRFIPPPYTKQVATKDDDPQKKKKKKMQNDRLGESARRRSLRPQGTERLTSTSNNEASSTGFRDLGSNKMDPILDSRTSEDGSRGDQRSSPPQRWKLPDYDELVARLAALRRR